MRLPAIPTPALPSLPSIPGLAALAPRAARRAAPPPVPMTEEEERSLLSKAMGFLEYGALALDKPGAAVRGTISGLLGGEWGGGLLNLIPFSGTLGITDPSERVYGRDVLEEAGILAPNVPGFDPGDVAGFGVDVLTDPLLLLTGPGKALTLKGLKAMKPPPLSGLKGAKGYVTKAGTEGGFRILGTTPKAIADEIVAGERGLLALKIPFAKEPFAVFGAGSKKAAKVVEAFHYGTFSPIRPIRYLWSKKVGGVWSPMEQKAADKAFSELQNIYGAVRDVVPFFSKSMRGLGDKFGDLAEHSKLAKNQGATGDFIEFQRYVAEKAAETDRTARMTAQEIGKLFGEGANPKMVDDFSQEFYRTIDSMSDIKDILYARFREFGGKGKWLDDIYVKQFPRRPSNKVAAGLWDEQVTRRLLPTGFPFSSGRKDVLKNIPDGSYTLNRASRDPSLTASKHFTGTREQLKDVLQGELSQFLGEAPKKMSIKNMQQELLYHKYLKPAAIRNQGRFADDAARNAELVRLHKGTTTSMPAGDLSDEAIATLVEQGWKHDKKAATLTSSTESVSAALADYLRVLPEEVLQTGLFDRSLIDDWMDYTEHIAVSLSNLHTVHHFLGQVVEAKPGDEMISVSEAWNSVRTTQGREALDPRGLDTLAANKHNIPKQSISMEGVDPEKMAELLQEGWKKEGGMLVGYDRAAINDALGQMYVPKETADVLGKYVEVMQPKTAGALGKMFDKYTNAIKLGWTIPWPAFQARNLVDGQWRNWGAGGRNTYGTFGKNGYLAAFEEAGREYSGASTRWADEIITNNVAHRRGGGRLEDIAGIGAVAESRATSPLGIFAPIVKGAETVDASKRAYGIPGTGFVREKWRRVKETGYRAYDYVEYMNRVSPYIALRKNGYSPSQAKYLVDQIQYDYALAGKGRRVHHQVQTAMRRLVPFWGFMSNNIPYQFSQLLNAPGGRHAQTLRFINAMRRGGGDYMPGWLRERTAVRLPGDDPENAQFLRKFGLSIEDLSSITFSGGLPDIARTGERFFASAHPAFTVPYKIATQRDPYSGRKLEHMRTVTGVPALDPILMGTPVSRAIRSGQEAMYLLPGRERTKPPALVGLDLLTGMQIGTYNLPRQRLFDLQEAWQQEMRRQPEIGEYPRLYIKKKAKEKATPERLKELNRELEKRRALNAAIKSLLAE